MAPDPYRILFPLGLLIALVGASLWPLHAAGLIPYPGPLHWSLMTQGFEQCFILGFLLTAMPSFLHAERAGPVETGIGAGSMLGFFVFTLAGWTVAAQAMYLAALILVGSMGVRRFRVAAPPPEEFLFVALGIALGLAGGFVNLAAAVSLVHEPSPRFGLRLVSLGMILSLVLGVGGLLVPTFSSMREPLAIPGLARPHERAPRRMLYSLLALSLVAALVLESAGRHAAGALTRAVMGSVALLWVWKIFRIPRARNLLPYCLWTAGWMIFTGLWVAALLPARSLAAYHVIFIGGFGFLTVGIATRVVVRHGRHPIAAEGSVLRPGVVGALALSLLARLGAELAPRAYLALLGLSGASWIFGWLLWGSGALPYIARVAGPAPEAARSAATADRHSA